MTIPRFPFFRPRAGPCLDAEADLRLGGLDAGGGPGRARRGEELAATSDPSG